MEPDRLAQLSRRYARYGRSLPGLSLALGGVVVMLLLLAPPLIGNNIQVCWENQRSLLALIAVVLLAGWLFTKEWLRQCVYQSLGFAESSNSARERIFNRLLAFTLGLLAITYPVRWLAVKPHPTPDPTSVQIYVGLTACFLLPWITLHFIRGIQEGLLWALLVWWALEFVWGFPNLGPSSPHADGIATVFILAGVFAFFGGLAIGLVQHFNFLRLAKEIRNQGTPDE